ncbi:MAG: hypothetical protein AAGA42_11045 [Actinomycetota bacterium]
MSGIEHRPTRAVLGGRRFARNLDQAADDTLRAMLGRHFVDRARYARAISAGLDKGTVARCPSGHRDLASSRRP